MRVGMHASHFGFASARVGDHFPYERVVEGIERLYFPGVGRTWTCTACLMWRKLGSYKKELGLRKPIY